MLEIYQNCPKEMKHCFLRETQARWATQTHLVHRASSCQM